MITVYHGDNQVISRQKLPRGKHVRFIDAAKITDTDLVQILESRELFGGRPTLVLENLLKSPSPWLKPVLAADREIYIWEDRLLSPAQLKKLQPAKIREFKLPPKLWQFLSSCKLADLNTCLKTESIELVWYLFHRQASRQGKVKLLTQMFTAELELKTGLNETPLKTRLELLLINH